MTVTPTLADPAPKADTPTTTWRLGPGLVTGAADDDPSGIATYSQAGAAFGLTFLWTMFLTAPLMVAVQSSSARLGRATGHGLGHILAERMPKPVMAALLVILLGANILNIGADLAAMGEALALVAGGRSEPYALGFAALTLGLQMVMPYRRYAGLLKWLTLSLFAYVGIVLAVHVPWGAALRATVVPHFPRTSASLLMVTAIFGTTISPYLFFWQASQEVEECRIHKLRTPHTRAEGAAEGKRIMADTWFGMVASNLVAYFIILTCALTLNAHGVTDIQTSGQAASALKPIAGGLAFALFALGIIGTGLLAVPVLAGSAAYAVADAYGWRASLEHVPRRAKAFYAVLAAAIAAGLVIVAAGVDPIKMLVWSAVVNGVAAPPIMAAMLSAVGDTKLMGPLRAGRVTLWAGWSATVAMTLVAAGGIASAAGWV